MYWLKWFLLLLSHLTLRTTTPWLITITDKYLTGSDKISVVYKLLFSNHSVNLNWMISAVGTIVIVPGPV